MSNVFCFRAAKKLTLSYPYGNMKRIVHKTFQIKTCNQEGGGKVKKIIINENRSVGMEPGIIGLFFEDINYNLDGGLYAEMIENRNFEARKSTGDRDDYHSVNDGGYGWRVWPEGAASTISIMTEHPQNEVNPHYLHADVKAAGEGFANKAYDGIYMKTGAEYAMSFYARSTTPDVRVQISVIADKKAAASACVAVSGDGQWNKYSVSLTAVCDVEKGTFAITLSRAVTVDFDFISMMPKDAVLGIFRRDLAEKLKELKPGFLRFPGGCIIEGNTLDNRYQWKKTLGPLETRRYNWNRWAVHGNCEENNYESPYAHYGQTLGVGYYEYFLLCEYLGAKPLPVLNVGLACQYQSTEQVPIDSEAVEEYIGDALDLIEFANGDTDTRWGAVRAEMGHPAPFGMELIGIGNEQWQTEKVDFFSRYERFEEAIHRRYPEMRLIGSAGPDVWSNHYKDAWDWVREKARRNPDFVYAMDEHYYVRPQWMYENADFYNDYPRGVKVFAGEYAAHVKGKSGRFNSEGANNFEAALAEAAFMTGLERNADVVVMASYAPLMARIGYTQWSPDLIWFDGGSSYGTPSYYVQKLYSLCRGERSLEAVTEGECLYASATYSEKDGVCIIKAVNSSESAADVEIECGYDFEENARCLLLAADPDDVNSTDDPEKVCPRDMSVNIGDGMIRLPAHSFSVIMCKVK